MNQKMLVLIGFIILCAAGTSIYFLLNKDSKSDSLTSNIEQEKKHNESEKDNVDSNEKTIVIYFSATGTTQKIAGYISELTNSNRIEIVPTEEYTDNDLNYNNSNSRANKEQNDRSSRPKIRNEIDIAEYDTIYLGYPIWWGDVPKIILTFVENNNLEGKKIIPFCTSHSSGMSTSLNTLKSYKELNIVDGRRFDSSSNKSDVESWLKGIK